MAYGFADVFSGWHRHLHTFCLFIAFWCYFQACLTAPDFPSKRYLDVVTADHGYHFGAWGWCDVKQDNCTESSLKYDISGTLRTALAYPTLSGGYTTATGLMFFIPFTAALCAVACIVSVIRPKFSHKLQNLADIVAIDCAVLLFGTLAFVSEWITFWHLGHYLTSHTKAGVARHSATHWGMFIGWLFLLPPPYLAWTARRAAVERTGPYGGRPEGPAPGAPPPPPPAHHHSVAPLNK